MATTEWQILVLEKLRRLVIGGYTNKFVGWAYEDETDREAENRALIHLHELGVMDVSNLLADVLVPDKYGVLVTDEEVIGADEMTPYGNAVIRNINPDAYNKQCARFDMDTQEETYRATVKIVGSNPVVTVLGKQYKFKPMQAGSIKETAFDFLSKHPNTLYTIDQLKEQGVAGFEYISKLVENNYFGKELSPFVGAYKSAIMFKPEAHISKEQLTAIQTRYKTA